MATPSPGSSGIQIPAPGDADPAPVPAPPISPSATTHDDPAFWPPGVAWRPVSPTLATVRRLGVLIGLIPVAGITGLVWWWTGGSWLPWVVGVGGLAVLAWSWVTVGRAVRSWGYSEREEDLLVRHGLLVRRLSVVPYGRMQFVDVTAGPLERALGIATVQLHTAAAASDAVIPGLEPSEAARLRDRLAALGEQRAAGL